MLASGAVSDDSLDHVDREILRQLQTDGRRPFREIARELGVSEATVRARVRPARRRERPAIIINTRGGKRSTYEYIVLGSTIFRVPRKGAPKAVGDATLTAKRRRWSYRFDLDEIRGLGAGYGWAATTQKRSGRFADVAPDRGYTRSP